MSLDHCTANVVGLSRTMNRIGAHDFVGNDLVGHYPAGADSQPDQQRGSGDEDHEADVLKKVLLTAMNIPISFRL
jgi:hypothetical protein